MINYFQAIILGLLQGVSELFPVSSLGHSVILPRLLGWHINQNDPFFLTFLVATHLATAIVLFLFFYKDWLKIIAGMARSLRTRRIEKENVYGRLGWLLVAGTIPAGILGLLLQDQLRLLFASARAAAFFLMLNGLLLYGAELLRRRAKRLADLEYAAGTQAEANRSDLRIAKTSWPQAFGVGLAQVIALIPGFSRSGSTMAGGILVGLSHEDAVRYSFLLATPIIAAAAILKLPNLFDPANHALIGPAIVGAFCAAITAYLAVKFLLKFFETNKLTPFAIYCFCAGAAASIYFLIAH